MVRPNAYVDELIRLRYMVHMNPSVFLALDRA